MEDDELRLTLVSAQMRSAPVQPDEANLLLEMCGELEEAVAHLPLREQDIVRRRFGLGGHDEHTLAQIGEAVGLSTERVRILVEDSLRTMSRFLYRRAHGKSLLPARCDWWSVRNWWWS